MNNVTHTRKTTFICIGVLWQVYLLSIGGETDVKLFELSEDKATKPSFTM